ncbi:MAG: hypothetical protein GBAus27B_000501 [Mycoplasmataceae bacterium]|nr:MAG: hypothetical protein GBAus27B_000501 [Mycoplasmataceae bacterium]
MGKNYILYNQEWSEKSMKFCKDEIIRLLGEKIGSNKQIFFDKKEDWKKKINNAEKDIFTNQERRCKDGNKKKEAILSFANYIIALDFIEKKINDYEVAENNLKLLEELNEIITHKKDEHNNKALKFIISGKNDCRGKVKEAIEKIKKKEQEISVNPKSIQVLLSDDTGVRDDETAVFQITNPLPIKITAIGGTSGSTKWNSDKSDFSRYTIEPITIIGADENRSIIINELVLCFRTWWKQKDSYHLKSVAPRAEIPNFLKNETNETWKQKSEEIEKLEDNLLCAGSEIKIQLSETDQTEKEFDWRFLYGKKKEGIYELEIFDNYKLIMSDGKEFEFNENDLENFIKKFQITKENRKNSKINTYLNNLSGILDGIKSSGAIPTDEQGSAIQGLESEFWQTLKSAKLIDFLASEEDSEERDRKQKEWERSLIELENHPENSWIKESKNQQKFLNSLEKLINFGYQASDDITLGSYYGKDELTWFYTNSDDNISFHANYWRKKIADYYANECQKLVGQIQWNIRQHPDWEETITQNLKFKKLKSQNCESFIEECIIKAGDVNDDNAYEVIDLVKKLAQSELNKENQTNSEQTMELNTPINNETESHDNNLSGSWFKNIVDISLSVEEGSRLKPNDFSDQNQIEPVQSTIDAPSLVSEKQSEEFDSDKETKIRSLINGITKEDFKNQSYFRTCPRLEEITNLRNEIINLEDKSLSDELCDELDKKVFQFSLLDLAEQVEHSLKKAGIELEEAVQWEGFSNFHNFIEEAKDPKWSDKYIKEIKQKNRGKFSWEIFQKFDLSLNEINFRRLQKIITAPTTSDNLSSILKNLQSVQDLIPENRDKNETKEFTPSITGKKLTLFEVDAYFGLKKEVDDFELNQEKTLAFWEIEKYLNDGGLKVEDLQEYSNYQEKINSLDEVQEIRSFRVEIKRFIIKLSKEESSQRKEDNNEESLSDSDSTIAPNEEDSRLENREFKPLGSTISNEPITITRVIEVNPADSSSPSKDESEDIEKIILKEAENFFSSLLSDFDYELAEKKIEAKLNEFNHVNFSDELIKKLYESVYEFLVKSIDKEWEIKKAKLGQVSKEELLGADWKEKMRTGKDKKTLTDEDFQELKNESDKTWDKISKRVRKNFFDIIFRIIFASREELDDLEGEVSEIWKEEDNDLIKLIDLRSSLIFAKEFLVKEDFKIDDLEGEINQLKKWETYSNVNYSSEYDEDSDEWAYAWSWERYNKTKNNEAINIFNELISLKRLLEIIQQPTSQYLEIIQNTLQNIQDLIFESANLQNECFSVTHKKLTSAQVSAYGKLEKRVNNFELELLKAQFLNNEQGTIISQEDKEVIKNASSKKNLEEKIKIAVQNAHQFQQTYNSALSDLINNNSSDFPWINELTEEDCEKIRKALVRSDNNEKIQREIAWDQFLRTCQISKKEDKIAWQEDSGLTVAEAMKIWWENGWTFKGGYGKNWKREFQTPTSEVKLNGTELLIHKKSETNKVRNLLDEIYFANDLTFLRGIKIDYDEAFVPTDWNYNKVGEVKKSKEFELFKLAFEGEEPSGLSDEEIRQWLTNNTGLAKNGIAEREAYDSGWTEPNKIFPFVRDDGVILSCVRHSVFSVRQEPFGETSLSLMVNQIDRNLLDLSSELLREIFNKTSSADLRENYRQADIESLDANKLPQGFDEGAVKIFLDFKRKELKKGEFISDFKTAIVNSVINLAKANDAILAYRKLSPNGEHQITGTEAGQISDNEWEASRIEIDDNGAITENYSGKKYNPLLKKTEEVEDELWIEFFQGKEPTDLTLSDDEVLAFYKKTSNFDLEQDAKISRQVFENGWKADNFEWRCYLDEVWLAIIPEYTTSHNQKYTNLNAVEINKNELDKADEILYKIGESQMVSELPDLQSQANRYNESKIPAKIKGLIEHLWNSKKEELELAEKSAKVKPDIDEIEAELNKQPVIDSNQLDSDYKSEMINLANDDDERNQYKEEIIAKIKQIKNGKLELARAIITNSQKVLEKDKAIRDELKEAVNDLKILANASNNSAEGMVWAENKDENEKLLNDLKTKLDKITPAKSEKEKPANPSQQPTPPPSPILEEERKFGKDYSNLNSSQQDCRKTICENWKKDSDYDRSQICHYCSLEFHYDKNLEFLPSQEKAKSELEKHENNCDCKNNEAKQLENKKNNWEKCKENTERYFYSCQNCWGKIEFDKSDNDWERTEKQARADLAYHQEHECGSEETKKISIYFSPNQGGNEHAPLSYANKIDESKLRLEKDNQGQVQQKQENTIPNKERNSYNQWLVGAAIGLIGAFTISILLITSPKSKRRKK